MTRGFEPISRKDARRNTTPVEGSVVADRVRAIVQKLGTEAPQLVERSLERVGLTVPDLEGRGTRITLLQEIHFVNALVAVSGDRLFAARLGLQMPGKSTTIVSYIKHSSRTLREAMESSARWIRLTRRSTDLACRLDGDEGHWVMSVRLPWNAALAIYQEFAISAALAGFRYTTGQPIRPLRVSLIGNCPVKPDLKTLWRCDVRDNAEEVAITFARHTLEMPLLGADQDLNEYLRLYADTLLQSEPTEPPSLKQAVETAVLRHLSRGVPSKGLIASELGMSQRTFSRRLSEQDLTYRGIVETLRKQRVEGLIRDPNLQLTEVAFLLGYAEQSSFSTAFRRWKGMSPRAYRPQVIANDAV